MQWERLGGAVMRRRAHLGYTTRQQFTDATGFPAKTLGDLEKHRRENFDPTTFGRLERALNWPVGTIDDILAGGTIPGEHLAVNPAASMPADPHPLAVELALLLADPTPLSAATRTALLNSLDRAMATARREARGLPAHDHGVDAVTYSTGGKMYIQAKFAHGPTTDIPEYLKNLAAADSPLDPSDRDAIRDGMTSLARLGYSLLIVARAADGTTDPRRADLTHPTGVSRIDR